MIRRIAIASALLVLVSFGSASFAQDVSRDKEIGVVTYKEYQLKWDNGYGSARNPRLLDYTTELGFAADELSVNIFLPEGKAQRDKYKRILIVPTAHAFFPEMYDGMKDYIQSGGLLITTSSLVITDVNKDYKFDEKDQVLRQGKEFIGAEGSAWCDMTTIKSMEDTPLTKGFEKDKWVKLEVKTSGRQVTNIDAKVAIVSDRTPGAATQPFLTYKRMGKGACIYIVGDNINKNSDKGLIQIFKNSLSAETLKWLCPYSSAD